MIEYISRSGAPAALNCPAFICDACGEQVTGRGNVYWGTAHTEHRSWSTPLYVSHAGRGRCVPVIEAWFAEAYPRGVIPWRLCNHEIGEFLEHLGGNLRHSFADEVQEENAEYLAHQVVMPAVATPASFQGVGRYVRERAY